MRDYNTLDDFDFEAKTVLLRVDFNLPLDKETFEVLDTTRIQLALPTIKELVEKKSRVVVLAHQGRKGSWDFIHLNPHAKALGELLGQSVRFVEDIYGNEAKQAIAEMNDGEVVMLDNVRMFDQETAKISVEQHAQSELVENLAPLVDIYVNDAFAAAHRSQCSLVGFMPVLPSCAGRLMEKELTTLEAIVKNPAHPSVFLFGGAKFSDVVVTVDRVLGSGLADRVLLTGLPANAFLKARGVSLGEVNEKPLLEGSSAEEFEKIRAVLSKYGDGICLPVDFAFEKDGTRNEVSLEDLPCKYPLLDISQKTVDLFSTYIGEAKTVFLSGPCGVFEDPLFRVGTKGVFESIAQSDAFSLVGGGHTVAAVEQLGLKEKMSHISTGGGSLEKFMMGEDLVVVQQLKKACKKNLVHA